MKAIKGIGAIYLTVSWASIMMAQTVTPTPHNPSGTSAPPMLPPAYATVVSEPSSGTGAPFVSVLDITGDSISAAQPLVSNPLGFTLDAGGVYANTINSNATMNYFPANGTLTSQTVGNDTVTDACTSDIFSPSPEFFTLDIKTSAIDVGLSGNGKGLFSLASGITLPQTPVAMTGIAGSHRYMIISQNVPYGVACNNIPSQVPNDGTVTVYDSSSGTSISSINVGHCPVYGVTSADGHRSFILNRGDDTVSVINVDTATLDTTLSIPHTAGKPAGPVYAEFVAKTNRLVVANYENDTVAIFNAALDNTHADGPAFGTAFSVDLWNGATHTTGKHPAGLTVMADGSRAYVANQEQGSVDVVDLRLNSVVSTLQLNVTGSPVIHPREVAANTPGSTNGLWGNIWVAAPDSGEVPYINVQGNAVAQPLSCSSGGLCSYNAGNVTGLRLNTDVSTIAGVHLYTSRMPGAGQPCMAPVFTPANLTACQTH